MKKWLLMAAAAIVTGCGSSVTGTPLPGASNVDIKTLRTGPFQTDPVSFDIDAGADGPENVRLVEARRLLNYLIHPIELDPSVQKQGKTHAFADDIPIIGSIRQEHKSLFKYNANYVAGVISSRTNGSARSPKEIDVGILQFASAAESSRVAGELHRIAEEAGGQRGVTLQEFPSAHNSIADEKTIDSWLPHGPYVLVSRISLPRPDLIQLTSATERLHKLQIASLNQQKPVPLDDVLDQPLDPENIMRRAMVRDMIRDPGRTPDETGTYQPSGMLHFERSPIEARQKYQETGVDIIGRRATTLYRTRDVAAAFQLQTFLSKPGKDDTTVPPPPGLQDAQCLRLDTSDPNLNHDVMCSVVYDRYVAVVTTSSANALSRVDQALQERTAAQYIILTKCGKA